MLASVSAFSLGVVDNYIMYVLLSINKQTNKQSDARGDDIGRREAEIVLLASGFRVVLNSK